MKNKIVNKNNIKYIIILIIATVLYLYITPPMLLGSAFVITFPLCLLAIYFIYLFLSFFLKKQ